MKPRWVVYGAYEGDKIQYIGKTGNLAQRSAYHREQRGWRYEVQ